MKLRARDDVTDEEVQAIAGSVVSIDEVSPDREIVRRDQYLDVSTVLLDGVACRFKDVRSGERQITELHVAGDFVDLHSFTLKRLDHDVIAITRCRFATVSHAGLCNITERFPRLTRVLWFSTNLDAAILREAEVSLGRRSAIARVAHLFCELDIRLGLVGLTDGHSYMLGMTQADIAECLGLTPVHVNRMIRELRELDLVNYRHGIVNILDWKGLQRIAEFDPSYLYLEHRSRSNI